MSTPQPNALEQVPAYFRDRYEAQVFERDEHLAALTARTFEAEGLEKALEDFQKDTFDILKENSSSVYGIARTAYETVDELATEQDAFVFGSMVAAPSLDAASERLVTGGLDGTTLRALSVGYDLYVLNSAGSKSDPAEARQLVEQYASPIGIYPLISAVDLNVAEAALSRQVALNIASELPREFATRPAQRPLEMMLGGRVLAQAKTKSKPELGVGDIEGFSVESMRQAMREAFDERIRVHAESGNSYQEAMQLIVDCATVTNQPRLLVGTAVAHLPKVRQSLNETEAKLKSVDLDLEKYKKMGFMKLMFNKKTMDGLLADRECVVEKINTRRAEIKEIERLIKAAS